MHVNKLKQYLISCILLIGTLFVNILSCVKEDICADIAARHRHAWSHTRTAQR